MWTVPNIPLARGCSSMYGSHLVKPLPVIFPANLRTDIKIHTRFLGCKTVCYTPCIWHILTVSSKAWKNAAHTYMLYSSCQGYLLRVSSDFIFSKGSTQTISNFKSKMCWEIRKWKASISVQTTRCFAVRFFGTHWSCNCAHDTGRHPATYFQEMQRAHAQRCGRGKFISFGKANTWMLCGFVADPLKGRIVHVTHDNWIFLTHF